MREEEQNEPKTALNSEPEHKNLLSEKRDYCDGQVGSTSLGSVQAYGSKFLKNKGGGAKLKGLGDVNLKKEATCRILVGYA